MDINEITGHIVDSSMKLHSSVGPGLLESAYEVLLAHALRSRGLSVIGQVPLPVVYEGVRVDLGYRLDMVVEQLVVVELKAVVRVLPVHEAQLFSYLKLSRYRVGLLINFRVVHLKDGIKRVIMD